LTALVESWRELEPAAGEVLDAARRLDQHYLPTR